MLRRTLHGHRDYVYQLAISHDGKRLASCGYDKSIRLWDVESGRVLSVLREHTDAVFAVAFSPDDKWIASGAGDRSVKIWDAQKGVRLYTLTDATDAVTTLQFRPGDRPAAHCRGNDKTIRTWALDAAGGKQVRSVIAHTAPVLALRYSPDGSSSPRPARTGRSKSGTRTRGRRCGRSSGRATGRRRSTGARTAARHRDRALRRHRFPLRHRDRQAHRRSDSADCNGGGSTTRPNLSSLDAECRSTTLTPN